MPIATWSLILAILALVISIWGRLETYFIVKRQQKLEQAKRAGEALISAQILKNTLSNNIDELESATKNIDESEIPQIYLDEFNTKLEELKSEYTQIWDFVKALENIVVAFETGKYPKLEPSAIEAKIAHFKQRREISLFDIEYLNNFYNKKIKQ